MRLKIETMRSLAAKPFCADFSYYLIFDLVRSNALVEVSARDHKLERSVLIVYTFPQRLRLNPSKHRCYYYVICHKY